MTDIGDFYLRRTENLFHPVNNFGKEINLIGKVIAIDEDNLTVKILNEQGIKTFGDEIKQTLQNNLYSTFKTEKELKLYLIKKKLKND